MKRYFSLLASSPRMRDLSRVLLVLIVVLLAGVALLATAQPAQAAVPGIEQGHSMSRRAKPAPPVAPAQVAIGQRSAGLSLSWTPEPEDTLYQVWRSTNPYFQPGDKGAELLITTELTAFTDTTVPQDSNVYYAIRGVNSKSRPSPLSDRVGRFSFGIMSGGQ